MKHISTPESEPPSDIQCANCGAAVTGKYCSQCGAEAAPSRLTFKAVFSTTIEHFLSLDFPLLRTILDLMRFPGRVASEYVAGRRKIYANPLKFSLITGTFLVAAIHFATGDDSTPDLRILHRLKDSSLPQVMKEAIPLAVQWNNDFVYLIYFLALPILALCMRVLFPRTARNTAEWYVLCLYAHGEIYLVQATCFLLAVPFESNILGLTLAVISGLSPIVLFVWAAVGFVKGNLILKILKSLLAYVVFAVAITALEFGAAIGYVIVKHGGAGAVP